MKIHPLKADYGDAIYIEIESQDKVVKIVIDGGPETTEDDIASIYHEIGYIDLLILTHYDEDHIKGILKFISGLKGNKKVIGCLWTNCARIIDFDNDENTAAYEDAFTLASHLSKLQKKGVVGEWRDLICTDTPSYELEGCRIDVLSPTSDVLEELQKRYRKYIDDHGLKDDPDLEEDVSYKTVLTHAHIPLHELVSKFKKTNTTFMNKTSIAIRIQAEGKTLLFAGDAEHNTLKESLERLGASSEKPMFFDLIKISHHGSKANISQELMALIDCTSYLITTSGGDGGAYHPDRMTLACLNYWPRKRADEKLTLYLNYPLDKIMERNTELLSEEERKLFNIVDDYANAKIPTIEL